MHISDTYDRIRLSKALYAANWQSQKARLRRTADAIESVDRASSPRLLPTVRLAARGAMATLAGSTGEPVADLMMAPFAAGLGADAVLPRRWLPASWRPETLIPYTALAFDAALSAMLVVGTGAHGEEVRAEPPKKKRVVWDVLLRYGACGAPEAAFVYAAATLAEHKYHKAAQACWAGAIVCAIPLELARVALWLAVSLVRLPMAAVVTVISVVYSAARCAWSPKTTPSSYVPFLKPAQNLRYRERSEQAKETRYELERLLATDPRFRELAAQGTVQSVHESLRVLSGVLEAASAADARKQLRRLCVDKTTPEGRPLHVELFITQVEQLQREATDMRGRQVAHRSSLVDTRTLSLLFAPPADEAVSPAPWENRAFRRISLLLHPDKLMPAGVELSPNSQRLVSAIYGMIGILRQIRENKPQLQFLQGGHTPRPTPA